MNKAVKWNEVTAVFGGTFDPPHVGHREAVQGLFANPRVRRVLVLPSGNSPFKPQAVSVEHRVRMAELNFTGLADVAINRRELERAAQTGKPSYTIETILELKRQDPQLAFVVGTDQLAQLHTWHRFRELLASCHWIVLSRRPDGEALAQPILREWEASGILKREGDEWSTSPTTRLKLVPTPAQALASKDIREKIARESNAKELARQLREWLQPDVLAYLMEHRIYGMTLTLKEFYEHDR